MNCWTYNRSKPSVNAGPFNISGLVCHLHLNQTLTDNRQTLLQSPDSFGLLAIRTEFILDSESGENETNANANRCTSIA